MWRSKKTIYVSRCGDPRKLFMWANQEEFEKYDMPKDKKYVRNIVFKEVLDV